MTTAAQLEPWQTRRADRDVGLVRAVGSWGLATSIINIVVGAGIFALPAALAASIGRYAPLAFLSCAVAVGAVAICFAEGGSRVPTSGGPYGYVAAAFGPLAGYVAGTLLWVSDLLACGGVAAALASVGASLVPAPLAAPTRTVLIIGVISAIALINLCGVVRGTRFISAATMFKLLPLVIFVIAGSTAMHAVNWLSTTALSTQGLGRALILGVFAFSGMETALSASGEVRQPARTIPRALAGAMLCVTVLYVVIQIVAQGILGPALAHSTVPLADAMARVHPALRVLMLTGAAVSMLGWIGTDMLGTPRVLFAFARDGLLPRPLGRLHPRTHAPQVAILCYAALAMVLALTGTFAELAVLSTLAGAALYIAGCAAAWQLKRGGVAHAGAALNFRWLGTVALIGIASMLALIALAAPLELLGLAALIGLSVTGYLLSRRLLR